MPERLDDTQVKQFTEDAENGVNAKALHSALSGMPFEDRYDALLQIQSANEKNRTANPNLPSLSVDLKLDNTNKSETVTLRRECDAWGPRGEPRNDYTHNFGPNRVDTSMYAGNSILCPGNDNGTSKGGGGGGGGGASAPTDSPDVPRPPWSGNGGGGGASVPTDRPDVPRPPWSVGGGGKATEKPDASAADSGNLEKGKN